ncbi:unnamed protein product [Dovyalis caffra]|uniref:Uncharacterized protein n=1 Tax=Dovyalis caffra TaxID=77055 RepID=A0AAV1RFL5_9ROSI|nr:unnamed protein product [Dovyalis caffra]
MKPKESRRFGHLGRRRSVRRRLDEWNVTIISERIGGEKGRGISRLYVPSTDPTVQTNN